MAYYINNAGKVMAVSVAAGVAKAAMTGDSSELKTGCLTALVLWVGWVFFVFSLIYFIIFK